MIINLEESEYLPNTITLIGSMNNQNFVQIPHSRFINMLKYKCERVGIRMVLVEESYTSQSSFMNLDPLPTYGDEIIPMRM